jgi:hypothetical protein
MSHEYTDEDVVAKVDDGTGGGEEGYYPSSYSISYANLTTFSAVHSQCVLSG